MTAATATGSPPVPEGFDPWSERFVRDPAAAFRDAAAQAPVFHYPPLDMWVITRYADLDACLPDFEALSHKMLGGTPVPDSVADRIPAGFFAESFIGMDPPAHTPPRKVAQRGFTRPRMSALEPHIAELAQRLIDGFVADGSVELMDRYCYALTIGTLLGLLGLPDRDEPMLRQLAKDHIKVLNTTIDPMEEPERTIVWSRYADAWDRLRAVTDERIADPGEDVISVMATATNAGGERVLHRDRVVFHVCELAFAGTDTTANLIANAVTFLSADPAQLALAREDRWAAVVEETLRRRPSVAAVPRLATRDLELDGVRIPAGARVWLALAGAAGDPARYPHPERFDLTRERVDDHLSFGKGRHFCMGAPLARAQGRIGLQTLYERLPDLHVLPGQDLAFTNNIGAPSRNALQVEFGGGR